MFARRSLLLLSLATAFCLCLGPAQADVVYNSFGYNDVTGQYDLYGGASLIVAGPDAGVYPSLSIAVPFTVQDHSYTLSSAEIAAWCDEGTPSLILSLCADNAGIPGTVREELGSVTAPEDGAILQIASATHPLLVEGQTYWLVAAPGANDTNVGWYVNYDYAEGTIAGGSGGSWVTGTMFQPVMRITGDVTTVPEPSALLALIGAIASTGFALRRRK